LQSRSTSLTSPRSPGNKKKGQDSYSFPAEEEKNQAGTRCQAKHKCYEDYYKKYELLQPWLISYVA